MSWKGEALIWLQIILTNEAAAGQCPVTRVTGAIPRGARR